MCIRDRQRDDDDGPRRRRRERQEQRREERLAVAAAALARRDGEGLDLEDVVDAAAVDRDLCEVSTASAPTPSTRHHDQK